MLDYPILFTNIPDLQLASATDDPLVLKKQVIYVGNFKKWKNAREVEFEFDVDEELIDHWVKTHPMLLQAGLDVPFPIGHVDDPEKRRGTVVSLSKDVDSKGRTSLYAHIKFNDEKTRDQLKNSQVSIYCPPIVRHQDDVFIRPIRHICSTDYPVVGDLEPFAIAAAYEPAKPKSKGNSVMMKALAEKLGLTVPPDASDDAIAGMIFAKFEELMKKDVDGDGQVGEGDGEGDGEATPVAASNDPMLLSLLRDNRKMKIDRLVADRKITPARAKGLKDKFTGKAISLSNDAFDALYEELEANDPLVALSAESSGPQRVNRESSVLVKDASSRK